MSLIVFVRKSGNGNISKKVLRWATRSFFKALLPLPDSEVHLISSFVLPCINRFQLNYRYRILSCSWYSYLLSFFLALTGSSLITVTRFQLALNLLFYSSLHLNYRYRIWSCTWYLLLLFLLRSTGSGSCLLTHSVEIAVTGFHIVSGAQEAYLV